MPGRDEASEGLHVIRCSVQGEAYGVDLGAIGSIERGDRLQPDRPPDGGCGWLAGRGGAIPVFQLAALLGRSGIPAGGPILVLDVASDPWAVQVSGVSRVLHLPAASRRPLPARLGGGAAATFQGLLAVGDELLLHLCPERLRAPGAPGAPGQQGEAAAGGAGGGTAGREAAAGAAAGQGRGPRPAPAVATRRPGRVVLFSAGQPLPGEREVLFGLSVSQVPEILRLPEILPVPRASAPWLGLVSWRGRPLPVLDLPARLGLPTAPVRHRRLLVARGPSGAIGIPIDAGVRMAALPLADRPCRRAPAIDGALVRGMTDLEERTLVIPDLDRL